MEITVDIVVCAELKYYKPIIKLFVGTGMTKNIYTMVERSQCFFYLRDRILFVAWLDGSFVLLHPFVKKTQKTPRREIEKAKRELQDLKERGLSDEE